MRKVVCDFDIIKSNIIKLCNDRDDIRKQLDKYINCSNTLQSSWMGSSGNEFKISNDNIINNFNCVFEELNNLIEFINECYTSIEKADLESSKVKIGG